MNALVNFTPAMFDAMRAFGGGAVTAGDAGTPHQVVSALCERGFLQAERTSSATYYEPTPMGWGAIAVLNAPVRPIEHETTCSRIQRVVAHYYSIPAAEMVSQRRSKYVARPRQIAMLLTREATPMSLPAIGRHFGKRDHTTVLHAINRIEDLAETDIVLRRDLASLRETLGIDA
jgi:hypothetical protein